MEIWFSSILIKCTNVCKLYGICHNQENVRSLKTSYQAKGTLCRSSNFGPINCKRLNFHWVKNEKLAFHIALGGVLSTIQVSRLSKINFAMLWFHKQVLEFSFFRFSPLWFKFTDDRIYKASALMAMPIILVSPPMVTSTTNLLLMLSCCCVINSLTFAYTTLMPVWLQSTTVSIFATLCVYYHV